MSYKRTLRWSRGIAVWDMRSKPCSDINRTGIVARVADAFRMLEYFVGGRRQRQGLFQGVAHAQG